MLPRTPRKVCALDFFHDTIGSYGPEDMEISHRYYDTEEDRAKHLAKYPTKNCRPV